MAKTIDYYDLPDRIATAEKKLKIPKWFDDFTVTEDWELKKESVSLDLSLSTTIIEKSYVRRGDRCFRIEDYCIYGWNVTTVTGTRVFIFRVNLTAVLAAINQAGMVAVLAARRRLVEYIESQDDFDVAKAVEIITRLFPAIPFGEVFRELAGFADLPSLLGDLDAIADRAMKVQAELRRLLALEGTVFARFGHVRMVTSLVRVQVFSHKDLIEVECADFILELPEGEALRVPEQDDFLIPPPKIDPPKPRRQGKKRVTPGDFRDPGDPQELPRKTLKAIRDARQPLGRLPGPRFEPEEIVRRDAVAAIRRKSKATLGKTGRGQGGKPPA